MATVSMNNGRMDDSLSGNSLISHSGSVSGLGLAKGGQGGSEDFLKTAALATRQPAQSQLLFFTSLTTVLDVP
ncbi:MAG: hypothetical protein Fur0046_16210 [Cyanobacteria bacterium J069]|nr:MAG: hypothetical protein D6742_03870 [Cyanobacteria bacterium J069]